MLTYSLDDRGSMSLYEYLYRSIKEDIVSCRLSPGEKLPSKRALSKHLGVSSITVENAYGQLMAEGYIYSVAKSGFFVAELAPSRQVTGPEKTLTQDVRPSDPIYADFSSNSTGADSFPFTTWAKLMRKTMSDDSRKLIARSPSAGIPELREAIAEHLHQFRGMEVSPENIIVGAGTEYLYGLIVQLLGRNSKYAVEDPGYQTIARIYRANDADCVHISLDSSGANVSELEKSGAQVLHISPSHHFPTGIVTPISRRYELLSWASKERDRYIIEDDYDSEFRLMGRPIPALRSIDVSGKVIYVNTFSKTLTGSLRISYMVLPEELMKKYRDSLSFYSCTVANFEQYTLAKFISEGHLERHINRMRKYYRNLRDSIISAAGEIPDCRITEKDSGLHFLLKLNTALSDGEIVARAYRQGIAVSTLSQYYVNGYEAVPHVLVLNYSGIDPRVIPKAMRALYEIIKET